MNPLKKLIEQSNQARIDKDYALGHQLMLEAESLVDLNNPYDLSDIFVAIDVGGMGKYDYIERAKKGNFYLTKLAELGNLTAIEFLITRYLYGTNGLEKDLEKSEYWTNKAAELRSIEGLKHLKNEKT